MKSGTETFTATPGPTSTGEDPDVISTFFEQPEETEPVRATGGPLAATYDTDSLSERLTWSVPRRCGCRSRRPDEPTQAEDAGKLVALPQGRRRRARAATSTWCATSPHRSRVPDVDEAVHGDDARLRAPVREGPQDPAGRRRRVPELPRQQRSGDGDDRHRRRRRPPRGRRGPPLQSMTLPTVAARPGPVRPVRDVPEQRGNARRQRRRRYARARATAADSNAKRQRQRQRLGHLPGHSAGRANRRRCVLGDNPPSGHRRTSAGSAGSGTATGRPRRPPADASQAEQPLLVRRAATRADQRWSTSPPAAEATGPSRSS